MPLETKELIVYLDQHIISNMIKAREGKISRPDLLALFEVIATGLRAEKLVCPRSWFHREEGSLTSLDSAIQRHLRYLGQVDFESPFEIERRQLFNAVSSFLGEPLSYTGWQLCLDRDPDSRLERFHIDANMPMDMFNFRERRRQHAEQLDHARPLAKGRGYPDQLAVERGEVPRYLHEMYGYAVRHVFAERPDGAEQYRRFLDTDLATAVTTLDLSTQLYASLLIHHNHRTIQTGDVTDIKIMSTLLPYCHVMTTDKFMKELVRSMKFDQRFGVRVFSGKLWDIALLTQYLTDALVERPPANTPSFTLLVIPDASIKEHLWDFFRALMSAARRWESRHGQWIELINVDDGAYPIYQHVRSGIRLDPSFLFEFDDEIASEGRAVRELAQEARGDVVVVVDKYHPLPETFLTDVRAAVIAGTDTVPRFEWPIVRRRRDSV